jgi:hypothetical protein
MGVMRKTGWFLTLAFAMAIWTGILGSLRGAAEAGVIASIGTAEAGKRAGDLDKIRAMLEQKIVLQKLLDYGVSTEEAMAKIGTMSDAEIHRLASLGDRLAAGSDDALGALIGLAILVILIIVIMKLLNKEIVFR